MNRNTAIRNKHRAIIKRDKPPCHLCGNEIDYSLPHDDPMSFQIDHITPLIITGPEGDTLDNLAAAHRACNRAKGAKRPMRAGVKFVTERTW